MDTLTKMIYTSLTDDKSFSKAISIMSDVFSGRASIETVEAARELEDEFPDYWENNQWVRIIAGSTGIDSKWLDYIKAEIKREFGEVQNDSKN